MFRDHWRQSSSAEPAKTLWQQIFPLSEFWPIADRVIQYIVLFVKGGTDISSLKTEMFVLQTALCF